MKNISASLQYIFCEVCVLSPSFRVDQCVILQVLSHEYSGTKWWRRELTRNHTKVTD